MSDEHFCRYDLVDTEGMAPEDLQDIPYMKVE